MKILVITLYYDPDLCQANGPIVRALCEDLAASGHEVTVLTSFPHYNQPSLPDEYKGKLFERDQAGRIHILRSYIYVSDKRSSLKRILNYLSFNISSTIAGAFSGQHDVIFVMSPPLTIGLTGWLLGKFRRIPFCYNVQDIWPEAAVKLGMLRGRKTIRFFEWLERFIYSKARRLFVISDEFRQNLRGKGVPEAKIEVIPNFVDTERIRPLEKVNTFSQQHRLTDKFVVLYAGNVGLSQGLEVILDAAEALQHHSEIVFLIVGDGSCREDLMTEAQRRQVSNVRFLPLQPETDVPLVYASCDIALIPLRRGLTTNSLPCKTYSIMASARPCIAGVDEGSNVWKLVEQTECGVCVPPENGAALAEAVLQIQADPQRARAMGNNGRAVVEAQFTRSGMTSRYGSALEKLCKTSTTSLVVEQVSEQ
jgi:colanic acid biosynthesis glycosyl transferase WcaI